MFNLTEKKRQREAALAKAEAIVAASEKENRALTEGENTDYAAAMAEYTTCDSQVKTREQLTTLRAQHPNGVVLTDAPKTANRRRAVWQSEEYAEAFATFAQSKGRTVPEALQLGMDSGGGVKFPGMSAVSYEGGATSGAPLFPTAPVDPNIIPLAPPEIGVQKLALVIPTVMDMPLSRKLAHGTAALKSEGDGTGDNLFTGTSPTTQKFTLSAYMMGHPEDASWELLQDVNTFQAFLVGDILLSLAVLKDGFFVTGSGTGEPQGIKGNVGTGVTGVLTGSDTYASEILDATFDVLGKLNAVYHNNASFLMARATSIAIRKAQKTANLFEPVFVRSNGVDYLHGYTCEYSNSVDAIGASATPVFFGDFKAGYIIGERGGSGVNVKILDQPKALEGLVTIIGYQRVDGRVRRSEAIQPIVLHS